MNNRIFSSQFKLIRKKYGLTQKQLANKLGISPSSVGMYEQNRRKPNLKILVKISDLFKIPLDILIDANITFHTKSKEITDIINELVHFIRNQNNLTLNSKLLSTVEKEKIIYLFEIFLKQRNDKL